MSQQYTHRNGETEPPTEEGLYWARGSWEKKDDPNWVFAIDGMVKCFLIDEDLGNTGPIRYMIKGALDDSYEEAKKGTLLCRWWGPVIPPWENE